MYALCRGDSPSPAKLFPGYPRKDSRPMTPEQIETMMRNCTLCPRQCHADRQNGQTGFCGQTAVLRAARAALHFWEEPCLTGDTGSGAVFFSGCSLQCVFCQNRDISLGQTGREITPLRLAEIFLHLQQQGAVNINLVTAGHFLPQTVHALELAKAKGLVLPIVYNTGSYEEVSSLKLLDGLVDIYLPDLKFRSQELSARYSAAPDYFEKACAAIEEMYRQTGPAVIDPETGLLKRGLIVRHLLLPGQPKDSKQILRYLHDTYHNTIYISILNQYTPLKGNSLPPELNRTVTKEEYDKILSFAERIGIEQGFYQQGETALESFIPPFDCEGV